MTVKPDLDRKVRILAEAALRNQGPGVRPSKPVQLRFL